MLDRAEARVDEHQGAKPFHNAIHISRDGLKSASIVLVVNTIVNSIMSLRSEPTGAD